MSPDVHTLNYKIIIKLLNVSGSLGNEVQPAAIWTTGRENIKDEEGLESAFKGSAW